MLQMYTVYEIKKLLLPIRTHDSALKQEHDLFRLRKQRNVFVYL